MATTEEQNKINFHLCEYSQFWAGAQRIEILLQAFKKLPDDMVLHKESLPGLPPELQQTKIVRDRIREVERENRILKARMEATREVLESLPGGKEALENWKWEESKE